MREFYEEELVRTQHRLEHIQDILKQLGGNKMPLKGQVAGKTVPKPAAARGSRKKPGRKSQWEALIMKRMRQLNKPVTYDELTREIMLLSKLAEDKLKSTKQAVISVVFRLRNRDGKLDTFSIGKKEKYIALKQWFEKPGEIKKEYLNKIQKPKPKTRRKK